MKALILLTTGLAAAALPTTSLSAQQADQARLVFSIGIGQTSGGGTLWSVGNQPFLITATEVDSLAVSRSFRRTLNVVFSGTYFPGEHFGLNLEAQLLGLGTRDACRISFTQGSVQTQDLCSTIDGGERSGTSAALSANGLFRVGSHSPIHPYLRAGGGFVVTQQSFLKTTGMITTTGGQVADLVLYEDSDDSSLQPYLSFGGGVIMVAGRGYQFRFELRDNMVWVPGVSGPTIRQGLVPPSSTSVKHLLTATIGFDIVLERKRGRRY